MMACDLSTGRSSHAFGFANPILVGEAGDVVAGHGRLAAARQLGIPSVPVIPLKGLSEVQRRQLTVKTLLGSSVPLLMVTDPPYGVDYDPTWRHRAGVNRSSRVGKVCKLWGRVTPGSGCRIRSVRGRSYYHTTSSIPRVGE
jgi:hypothetical protein